MPTPAALNVQPPNTNWKEAASLIIVAPNSDNDDVQNKELNSNNQIQLNKPFDYSILMVQRSSAASFMASALVFPGGQIELSDFELKWYDLFEKYGMPREKLNQSISGNMVGPRPPIVLDSISLRKSEINSNFINSDIALRISAIRETFEEAGILLLTSVDQKKVLSFTSNDDDSISNCSSSISLSPSKLTEWQLRVRKSSNAFYDLCDELNLVPNVWSLYEWSDWLTPVNVGHRRFDTLFYVCCLAQKPQIQVDNVEVIKPIWRNPLLVLEDHLQEQVFLAPPQVYELSRISHFNKLNQFHRFLRSRQILGTERWLPVMFSYTDGTISVLPGDDRYPTEPQLVSVELAAEFEGSIDDANSGSLLKNRIEIRGIQSRALCTVEPGYGHMAPLTFEGISKFTKSKL